MIVCRKVAGRVCSTLKPMSGVATINGPPIAALAEWADFRVGRSARIAAGAPEPIHSIARNASPLRSFVRLRRYAHDRNVRSPKNLLRSRAEENLLDPALMPS